jgi:hypothetical protein
VIHGECKQQGNKPKRGEEVGESEASLNVEGWARAKGATTLRFWSLLRFLVTHFDNFEYQHP